MQKSNTQNLLVEEVGDLYMSCFDSIQVTDRTTFDSCVVDGLHVTFWLEDDAEERVNKMFDLLFDGMIKSGNTRAISILGVNHY